MKALCQINRGFESYNPRPFASVALDAKGDLHGNTRVTRSRGKPSMEMLFMVVFTPVFIIIFLRLAWRSWRWVTASQRS